MRISDWSSDVCSSDLKGRISELDTRAAERAPGVLYVMTYRNAPAQADFDPPLTPTTAEVFTRARPVLATDRVRYYDEPVALGVALRSEERRVGKECVSPGRSGWSPDY